MDSLATPASTFQERRRRLFEAAGRRPILIGSGTQRARNFPANVYPFRASSHFLYLTGLNKPDHWLLLNGTEALLFRDESTPDDVLWHGPDVSHDSIMDKTGCVVKSRLHLADYVGPKTAGLPMLNHTSAAAQHALLERTVDIHQQGIDRELAQAMVDIRLVHDDAAIAQLRCAADATVAAHRAARKVIEPGRFAYEVWAEMQAEFTRRGMEAAYGPIVTTHGEVLHAHELDTRLKAGDLLLIDVGAETSEGWAGDVTRTWPVSHEASASQRAIHQLVCGARDAAIKLIAPGVEYRDIHLGAALHLTRGLVELGILKGEPEGLVERDVHALFFPHGVGHLLGLDVHDMEDLGDLSGYEPGRQRSSRFGLNALRLDRKLMPGMVVTIEPGFYQIPALMNALERIGPIEDCIDLAALSGYADVRGIRIEDDVLVTENGCDVLTEAMPRTLACS